MTNAPTPYQVPDRRGLLHPPFNANPKFTLLDCYRDDGTLHPNSVINFILSLADDPRDLIGKVVATLEEVAAAFKADIGVVCKTFKDGSVSFGVYRLLSSGIGTNKNVLLERQE